jgi:hypothetical protein
MTFPAREVAPRLVNGKIVLGPRKVNCRDASERAMVTLLKSDFAGKSLFPLCLDKATSLRVSLLNQMAFHL